MPIPRCSTGLSTPTTRLPPTRRREKALGGLAKYRLAILSNGSPDMLDALVRNSGLNHYLEAVISVDAKKAYKPDARAYELIQERLGVRPDEVAFVSSNGFDIAGAKSFGFNVVRIERVTPASLRQDLTSGAPIGPATMFRALRMQTEGLGFTPDAVVDSLSVLPDLISVTRNLTARLLLGKLPRFPCELIQK